MPTVTKVHTFVANQVANASEVNRNFDDLYNAINANLDSANLATTLTWAASQISINDTASYYSSTNLEGALEERQYAKGAHTIHNEVLALSGIMIFPGILEVNGKICENKGVFTVTSPTVDDSNAFSGGNTYYLTCQQNASITASDIFCIVHSSINITATNQNINGGYYYNNKRVFASFHQCATSVFSPTNDDFNPAPPSTPFSRNITDGSEACALGFITVAIAQNITGTYIQFLNRYFDKSKSKYGYEATVIATSSTLSTILHVADQSYPEFTVDLIDLKIGAAGFQDAKIQYVSSSTKETKLMVSASVATQNTLYCNFRPMLRRSTSGDSTN